ncbi:unnamed protein product [Macrosiphum euphorbiae]|uniref:Uncharacterized protein n=1 Tax=Macrosiphum euphorbiae TaxID=13131 RepID=A0AAV0XN47_9HEMI|nr:unnamed protein product [Macrosiphum euphorbiae]
MASRNSSVRTSKLFMPQARSSRDTMVGIFFSPIPFRHHLYPRRVYSVKPQTSETEEPYDNDTWGFFSHHPYLATPQIVRLVCGGQRSSNGHRQEGTITN